MQALQVQALNGPDALELVDVPEPRADSGQVLIDVYAAGVSFVDLLLSRGEYQVRPQLPFIPGIEVAGVARQAPQDSGLVEGERVFAFAPLGGGFAETAITTSQLTYRMPAALFFEEAAALTVNYQTALLALCRRGRLTPGETVLVHGAAGGVGTAAIQVAKAHGARVLALTSTTVKAAVAKAAGADEVLVANEDWVSEVRESSGGGVDLIFDPVGGQRSSHSLRCLAPEGRLLVVGFADGKIPELALNRVLLRHADVIGVNWGGFFAVDPAYHRACAVELARLADDRLIRPLIGQTYALADGARALRDLATRRTHGKVVISIDAG